MKTVGLKVLKNKLSEYVRAAEQGETFLIADRERIVAELVPPAESRAVHVADAVLADLLRNGLLSPALLPPGLPPPTDAVASWDELAGELDRDRDDR